MADYAILEAPSALGLIAGGVEHLPTALLDAGLAEAVGARHAGRVEAPRADGSRDRASGVLNATALRAYTYELAAATGSILASGDVPVVLGGDCSILLGTLLAARRRGRCGLLFVDGHADFYQPAAEPNGEAASMDLAFATGRGPDVVTPSTATSSWCATRTSSSSDAGTRRRLPMREAGGSRTRASPSSISLPFAVTGWNDA